MKKQVKKKAKKTKPVNKGLWITIGIVFAALVIGAVFALSYAMHAHGGDTAWVRIPAGASEKAVKDSIVSQLGNDEGGRVAMLWSLFNSNPATSRGAYRVTRGQAVWRTAYNIARGRQTPVTVTWNNVRTLDALAEEVADGLDFSADDFIIACRETLGPEGFDDATLPAAFLPDSYEFYWGAQPADVIKKMYAHRKKFWNEERTAKAKGLGLTPTQVAIVASIVEEETAKKDEMPKVARLYLNRLAKGMPLQADPTVKFAIGDFSIRRITNDMLRTDSPYNTYRNKGLPPGPIRVASQTGIEAVLNAPAHKYLYMCAKEDFSGYHNFATDYATHMANARRYQAELDRRNIR